MAPPPVAVVDLGIDVLVLLLSYLTCIADRQSTAGVASSWRLAASLAPAPPAQLPWAIFLSPTAASTIFSILSGSRRRIHLPADLAGSRLCGSQPGDWLAVAGHAPSGGGNMAVNLLSGVRVSLPDKKLVPLSRRRVAQLVREGSWMFQPQREKDVVVRYIAFSAPPTCAAAITQGKRPSIALCWLGGGMNNHWRVPYGRPPAVEDIVFFEGGGMMAPCFYFITNRDTLFQAFYGGGINISVRYIAKLVDDMLPTLPSNVYISRYLVVSRGHMLMVRRYYSYSKRDGTHQTMFFRVFQLHIQNMAFSWLELYNLPYRGFTWLELDNLGHRALFLSRCSSRAYELPDNSDIKAGSVFFLDDIAFGESVAATSDNQYNCNDMGVYYKEEPGFTTPTLYCSPLYGPQNLVACLKHEGKMEIMLFENLQELETYVGDKPVVVEIKGYIHRFIWEPTSKCPPALWLAH